MSITNNPTINIEENIEEDTTQTIVENTNKEEVEKHILQSKFIKYYSIITPFIDDIFHILTSCLFKPYLNLEPYPHYANTFYKLVKKVFIETIAFSGMLISVVKKSNNSINRGLIYSLLHIVLSYIVPLLLLPYVMNISKIFFSNKNYINVSKLILGLIFIFILGYIIELIFEKYKD